MTEAVSDHVNVYVEKNRLQQDAEVLLQITSDLKELLDERKRASREEEEELMSRDEGGGLEITQRQSCSRSPVDLQ